MLSPNETHPAAEGDHLLDVHQVAAKLRLSRRKVWKLVETSQMPAPLKLGRSSRWRASEIEEFIANGCRVTA